MSKWLLMPLLAEWPFHSNFSAGKGHTIEQSMCSTFLGGVSLPWRTEATMLASPPLWDSAVLATFQSKLSIDTPTRQRTRKLARPFWWCAHSPSKCGLSLSHGIKTWRGEVQAALLALCCSFVLLEPELELFRTRCESHSSPDVLFPVDVPQVGCRDDVLAAVATLTVLLMSVP